MKQRYAIVGASNRAAGMFAKPLKEDFSEEAQVVGIFDINPLRINALKEFAGLDCPGYTDFDTMMREQSPDRVIVATKDSTHHEFIIKSLEAGVDVISEKPMTTDEQKCQAILDAEKRTGKKVCVTFNMRCTPCSTAVKQAVVDGLIGDVLSVNLEYLIGSVHGSDYYRRWHRRKENSGGLLVHKSTHHFDLVNWWINAKPVDVMAFGERHFFGPVRTEHSERCSTCPHTASCEFYFDLEANDFLRKFYKECEASDNYFRDTCVFSEEIDIEDTMSVNVRYSGGILLNYSLISHSPYEGYRVCINGTGGRLEIEEYYSTFALQDPCFYLNIYDRKGQKLTRAIPRPTGDHGGGDEFLRRMLFRGVASDPLNHQADSIAGALSMLIGVAANKSIAEGRRVGIGELIDQSYYNC